MSRKEEVKLLCSKWYPTYPTYPDSPSLDEETDKYSIEQLKKRHIVEKAVEWADGSSIERVCKCYCDDICDKGRSGMCFHKHDGQGQVKNDFKYNECNELELLRNSML